MVVELLVMGCNAVNAVNGSAHRRFEKIRT